MPAFQHAQVSVSVSCKATTASFHTVLFCAAPTPAASSYSAVRTALPLLLQRRRPRQHHFHSGVNKHGLRRKKKKRAAIPRLSTNASLSERLTPRQSETRRRRTGAAPKFRCLHTRGSARGVTKSILPILIVKQGLGKWNIRENVS